MKKFLLSAAAVFAALSMNAQEICTFNADNALGLDSENGTALTAGTVIGETESIVATIGADDTYKPQSAKFTVNGIRFQTQYSHQEDLLFCYEAMKRSPKAVFTSEPLYHYCANDNTSASRKPFGDKQMTMLDVWDYIRKDGLKCFPELKGIINSQYYRNYIMCAMMAHSANYQSPIAWKRIKMTIGDSLLKIIMSPLLAMGYKLNALKVLLY